MFDEIHAEGIHRDATRVRQHGPASDTVQVASKVRLKQHLGRYKGLQGPYKRVFQERFHKASHILQIGRAIRQQSLLRGVRSSSFPKWFYRMDNLSHLDYKVYNRFIKGPRVQNSAKSATAIQDLSKDFFGEIFGQCDFVTMPMETGRGVPAIADAGDNADVPSTAGACEIEATCHFKDPALEIVDLFENALRSILNLVFSRCETFAHLSIDLFSRRQLFESVDV